jgi:3',5'-nucleoside bisphosphate phosphatase
MKLTFLLFLCTLVFSSAFAQTDTGILEMNEFEYPVKRQNIEIPGFNGFQVLKCDFHMHTVFSDGNVWPAIRVQEAWMEGLDAIAITDHIEYHPHSDDIKADNNRSYNLAKDAAAERNLILVKASEITRQTPPGHFNALFVSDASGYLSERANNETDRQAIAKPVEQKAFIFWNHPGWKAASIPGSYEWIDFVDELYKSKNLHGIEVFNGLDFYKKSLDWCIDKNLTVLANTDVHGLISTSYKLGGDVHRTMTLVFAKERSESGIREALEAGRTVAWSSNYLAGKEELLKQLFRACVKTGKSHFEGRGRKSYEIRNSSALYFELKLKSGKGTENIKLYPYSTQVISAPSDQKTLEYEAITTFVRGDKNLTVEIPLEN